MLQLFYQPHSELSEAPTHETSFSFPVLPFLWKIPSSPKKLQSSWLRPHFWSSSSQAISPCFWSPEQSIRILVGLFDFQELQWSFYVSWAEFPGPLSCPQQAHPFEQVPSQSDPLNPSSPPSTLTSCHLAPSSGFHNQAEQGYLNSNCSWKFASKMKSPSPGS